MRRSRGMWLAFVLVGALLAPLPALAVDGARIVEAMYPSQIFGRKLPARILLPAGYDAVTAPLPVLYILHGALGESDCTEDACPFASLWLDLLSPRGIVGVVPSDGAPWTDPKTYPGQEVEAGVGAQVPVVPSPLPQPDSGPLGGVPKSAKLSTGDVSYAALGLGFYETSFVNELLPFVENNFNVKRDRGGRGIMGHSAGSYGSFTLALHHPDLFSFVAGSSGPLHLRDPYCVVSAICSSVATAQGSHPDPTTDEIFWRSRNPYDLAENFLGLPTTIAFSSGVGCGSDITQGGTDPTCNPLPRSEVEHLARILNDEFDARLTELGVAHAYVRSDAPTHCLSCYHMSTYRDVFIPLAAETFESPLPPPSRWSYMTTERSFALWNYTFAVRRPNTEFLRFQDVDAGGFDVSGTGTLTVATPPLYAPRERYRVTRSGAGEEEIVQAVDADAQGRLWFTIPLGPARLYDEHSALAGAGASSSPEFTVSVTLDAQATSSSPIPCAPAWVYPVMASC